MSILQSVLAWSNNWRPTRIYDPVHKDFPHFPDYSLYLICLQNHHGMYIGTKICYFILKNKRITQSFCSWVWFVSSIGCFNEGYRCFFIEDTSADRGKGRHDVAVFLYGNILYNLTIFILEELKMGSVKVLKCEMKIGWIYSIY